MSIILERYLPPIPYAAENPERLVNLDGKPVLTSFDSNLVVHLNAYRPLWAIGGMRSLLVKKKGLVPGSQAFLTQQISFTLTLFCGGVESRGDMMHVRIITNLRECSHEVNGQCMLEKAMVTLVKAHVNRPQKQSIKRPADALDRLDQAKKEMMTTCMTQEDGPTRAEVAEMIDGVRELVVQMQQKD